MGQSILPGTEAWLRELAGGHGRTGDLTGAQRHFLRVLDGLSLPIRDEKQWLAYVRACEITAPELPACAEISAPQSALAGQVMAAVCAHGLAKRDEADESYRRRLATRDIYRRAEANATHIGEGPLMVEPVALKTAALAHVEQAHQPAPSPTMLPANQEEADLAFIFWTAWCWRQAAQGNDGQSSKVSGFIDEMSAEAKKLLRNLSDGLQGIGGSAGDVGVWVSQAVEAAGKAIADTAQKAVVAAGDVRRQAGARATSNSDTSVEGRVTKMANQAVESMARATQLASAAIGVVAEVVATNAEVPGKFAEGIVKGTADVAGGTVDAVAYSDNDINTLKKEIETAQRGCKAQREKLTAALAAGQVSKPDLHLELLTIAGLTLADVLAGAVIPGDVQAAYAAAFPNESLIIDFSDKAASLGDGPELLGLVSAVKGKLFELQYVDELNDQLASQGLHAALAESATQPGWDIKVTDSDGSLVELMSLKATDHAAYITHALERYPDIDVVSTSEVYAAMAGTPEGAHLIDGGIDNVDLTTHVGDAAGGGGDGLVHAGLSFLALLPAAYKHFIASDKSAGDKTSGFTEQVSRAKVSAIAGKVAMLAVPYWPAALLVSVGVSMVARVGDNRREQHDRLTKLLGSIRAESGRLLALRKAIQPLSA